MYELGSEPEAAHAEVGRFAGRTGLDYVIAVGEFAKGYAEGAVSFLPDDRVLYCKDKQELMPKLDTLLAAGDVVLVKASRGMEMEEIVKEILKDKETR